MAHTLVWDHLPGAAAYNVYANNSATRGVWLLANATPLATESFTDTTILQPGALYRVTALFPDGRQGSSDMVYANPPKLQVPAGFTATQVGVGQVRLSWQPVGYATGYRLFGPGQPPGGSVITATQLLLANLPGGTYSWQLTADYGGAWQGAGMPVASITLGSSSGANFRVVANGFRVVHETVDDLLSRDGKYDEVYAAFAIFHYDLASSRLLDRDLRRTLVHGDVNNLPGRIRAGTASAAGGLRGGDVFPQVGDPAKRYGAPITNQSFPFLVWQGALNPGQDALVILPTMWEFDGNAGGYDAWFRNEVNEAPRVWSDLAVQQALAARSLGMVAPAGLVKAINGPVINAETTKYAMLGAFLTGGSPTAATGLAALLAGSYDRPIGLLTGPVPLMPRRALVLTREMIDAALGPPPGAAASATPGDPLMASLDKAANTYACAQQSLDVTSSGCNAGSNGSPPSAMGAGASGGTIAIPFDDAPAPDLQGRYVLYLQVERVP